MLLDHWQRISGGRSTTPTPHQPAVPRPTHHRPAVPLEAECCLPQLGGRPPSAPRRQVIVLVGAPRRGWCPAEGIQDAHTHREDPWRQSCSAQPGPGAVPEDPLVSDSQPPAPGACSCSQGCGRAAPASGTAPSVFAAVTRGIPGAHLRRAQPWRHHTRRSRTATPTPCSAQSSCSCMVGNSGLWMGELVRCWHASAVRG